MKENKESTQVEESNFYKVLRTYYERFLAFDIAYKNEFKSREDMAKELQDTLVNEDSNSDRFKNTVREYMTLNSMHSAEVAHSASKFFIAADLYQLVTKKELEEDMAKKYIELKDNEYKSAFSVKNGKFIRNKDVELPKIPQE